MSKFEDALFEYSSADGMVIPERVQANIVNLPRIVAEIVDEVPRVR